VSRVLITGVAGQDGTILAKQLTRQGRHVVGLIKPGTDPATLQRYVPDVALIECDLASTTDLRGAIREVEPEVVFNLGGFTAPGESWEHEAEVHAVNVDAVEVMLEEAHRTANVRFFQASSASIFEGVDVIPQTEKTTRSPRSPYAVSKVEAMKLVDQARQRGIFATSAILYNHESPLRGPGFVTRRISMAVARIAQGKQDYLELGDIDVARDWGWASDYTRAMMLMIQADVPHDYVLATGISHRLSFFLSKAFEAVGITDWRDKVRVDEDRIRGTDTNLLVGDARSAYVELGWHHTVDFDSMAKLMVQHDVQLLTDPESLWTID
jgi:GDPmannose 4,6-dehydratase